MHLNARPYSVVDLLADVPRNFSTAVQSMGDVLPFAGHNTLLPKIVWRERSSEPIKKKVFLSETGTYPQDITVNEENGFYIVQPHESVIFLSKIPSPRELLIIINLYILTICQLT